MSLPGTHVEHSLLGGCGTFCVRVLGAASAFVFLVFPLLAALPTVAC